MRNIQEEFDYIKENEGDTFLKSLSMLIETQNKKNGKSAEEGIKLTEQALTVHIMQSAIIRKVNEIVEWINMHSNG